MKIRRSEERGKGNYGWLNARYSFSFAGYQDPQHTGFRDLLVINEDRIDPAMGFDTHPHRDMEIITFIIEGALRHTDSVGNEAIIQAGEVQRMTAGSGIRHSEYNASQDNPTHLLQIWIKPNQLNLEPGYEQMSYVEKIKGKKSTLLVSPNGKDNSLKVHQDMNLHLVKLNAREQFEFPIESGRHLWLQMLSGEIYIGEETLKSGDALAVSDKEMLEIAANSDTSFLVFDLI